MCHKADFISARLAAVFEPGWMQTLKLRVVLEHMRLDVV